MKKVGIGSAFFVLSLIFALSSVAPPVAPQGSNFDTAQLIQKGTHRFTLQVDQNHYFKIQLSTTDRLFVFLVCPTGADYDLYIYDSSRREVVKSTTTTLIDWIRMGWPLADTLYYIRVKYYRGPSGTYELTVGPLLISSGTYSATFYEAGAAFYEIRAEAGWALEISMTQPPDTDIDVSLYDSEGQFIASSRRGVGAVEQISATLARTGSYLIWIYHDTGPGGRYELTVITGPKVTLRIQGLPSSLRTTASVGGRPAQDIMGGASADVIIPDGQLATISVSEYVRQTDQVRYYCRDSSWFPSTSSHTFTYVAQYWLETSDGGHGTVSPSSGWYDSGASVTVSISPTTVLSGADTKYVFERWDGASTSSSDSVTLTMNSAKSIAATWKTQYYLNVESEHGTPTGEGWHDSGTQAQISVEESVGFIPVRYVFERWSGAGVANPTSRSTTVSMSGPRTVTAVWREDYTYTIAASAGVLVIIGAVAFVVFRKKPSAPQPPTYAPPPPPP